ncbi:MAG: site-specific DNA-methyltransferase [Candidatus Omnitrophica bacterium]|nr:site-specific DNA-methyltransferase [Candidatus Omnitrophota bacterium]
MKSTTKKKNPRKPKLEENKPGKYDKRNKVNSLTGRDWLLLSGSFWTSVGGADDKEAYGHPAPFLTKDIQKLVGLFTKKGMTVLDPFAGSGTTLLASNQLGRIGIGIDINSSYKKIAQKRLCANGCKKYEYIVGDSLKKIDSISTVDYIVTSPPYHNILQNNGKGIRHHNGKSYRMGAREGVECYTNKKNDLGNFNEYDDFISSLSGIMSKSFSKLKKGRYCTVIMSDFTVNKKEKCVQADIVPMMEKIGFEFCGTVILLQPVKPLFPFGYPYAYKINHQHHNMMHFRKPQ